MFPLSLEVTRTTAVPFIVMIIGLLITIYYLLYVHTRFQGDNEVKKDSVKSISLKSGEFECPRCRAHVDADSALCMDCGAEFEMDKFSCPVCGVEVSHEDETCPECKETFIVDEKKYVCPICKAPVDVYSNECKECNSKFWSPVRRYEKDHSVKEKKDKKINPDLIEIVGDDQD